MPVRLRFAADADADGAADAGDAAAAGVVGTVFLLVLWCAAVVLPILVH